MNRRFAFILFLILAVGLSACSAARSAEPTAANEGWANSGAPSEGRGNYPVAQEEAAAEEPAMEIPAGAPEMEMAAQPTMAPPGVVSDLAFAPVGGGMVIKDASIDLLVQDTSAAISRVTGLVGELSGYIISSQTWYQDGYLYASLRIGIPSGQFEEALNQLRRMGLSVLSENAQGQDVTDEYVDLQSRLTNLEATAARVRSFLDEARTVEDSLRISKELSNLEQQIEQVKGQTRYIEGRTAYSTVTVSLTPQYATPTPVATATPTPTPVWNPGQTFDNATSVLATQFRGFIDALIWITVVLGPWITLLALIFLIARALARKTLVKGR